MNLKYPENKKVYCGDTEVEVRPYLKHDEIVMIAEEMLKQDNYAERELTCNGWLLKLCVPNTKFDGMDYDLLVACGFIEKLRYEIINLNAVYLYVSDKMSAINVVNEFLDDIIKIFDKLSKKIPNEKALNALLTKYANHDKQQQ